MPEDDGDLSEMFTWAIRLVQRRRWWILATACVTTLVTIGVLLLLPNRYTSDAILLVVQQQVPERYVTPTTTTDIASALQAMTQEVLSRTRLLQVIDSFGLYANEKQHLAPEDVIALMRRNIAIAPLESAGAPQSAFNAFRISFTANDPHLSQEVTSRLTSLFIQENLKTREDQAGTTTNFLRAELESAKARLDRQEQRLRDFKMGSLGELPEQQQGNVQILGGLQTQLQNTMASLARAEQQRLYLESLVRNDLARLSAERSALLGAYTPKHPRMLKLDREIANKQALLEGPKPASSPVLGQTPAASPGSVQEEPSVDPLKSQLDANRMEIANLSNDEKQMKTEIARYQQRLNLTPVREQQLAAIARDYDLLKQNYADLLGKEQQSQLAMSLEKQEEGQHFRLVDPPSLPTLPSSPKRIKLSLDGVVGGIVLGFLLAFFADKRDKSFNSEKELAGQFSSALILSIPLVQTPFEQRRRNQRRVLECLAGSALVVIVAVAEYYVYRNG